MLYLRFDALRCNARSIILNAIRVHDTGKKFSNGIPSFSARCAPISNKFCWKYGPFNHLDLASTIIARTRARAYSRAAKSLSSFLRFFHYRGVHIIRARARALARTDTWNNSRIKFSSPLFLAFSPSNSARIIFVKPKYNPITQIPITDKRDELA